MEYWRYDIRCSILSCICVEFMASLKLIKSQLVGSGMGWLGLWRCLPSYNFAGHRCGICFWKFFGFFVSGVCYRRRQGGNTNHHLPFGARLPLDIGQVHCGIASGPLLLCRADHCSDHYDHLLVLWSFLFVAWSWRTPFLRNYLSASCGSDENDGGQLRSCLWRVVVGGRFHDGEYDVFLHEFAGDHAGSVSCIQHIAGPTVLIISFLGTKRP